MKKETPKTLSNRFLALVGGAVGLFAAFALAPASLAPALARSAGVDMSVANAVGTLWRGELKGVYVKGVRLGDIAFRTRPLALIAGGLAFDITSRDGALTGKARASIALNGEFSLSNARFLFDLSAANNYVILGQPMSGSVRADIDELVIARKGCMKAGAKLWTDVLAEPAKRFHAAAMNLAGDGACDGRDLVVAFSGESADGAVSMTLRITPDLFYTLEAEASPARTEVADVLRSLNFQTTDGMLSIATSGAIKTVGS